MDKQWRKRITWVTGPLTDGIERRKAQTDGKCSKVLLVHDSNGVTAQVARYIGNCRGEPIWFLGAKHKIG